MSAQILPFPKTKKRGAKVRSGPCAEITVLTAVRQPGRCLTSANPVTDELFNDFLVRTGLARAVPQPKSDYDLDERFNAFLVKTGIVSGPELA